MADWMYHIATLPEEVALYVLLPGDPHRVPKMATLWDEGHFITDNRDHGPVSSRMGRDGGAGSGGGHHPDAHSLPVSVSGHSGYSGHKNADTATDTMAQAVC